MGIADGKAGFPTSNKIALDITSMQSFKGNYFTLLQLASYCDILASIMKKSLVYSFAEKTCYHILNKKTITKMIPLKKKCL